MNTNNFINNVYNETIYSIISYEKKETYTIQNNKKITYNYFDINNISRKNLKKIYNYLEKNYKLEIITLYSYFNNMINSFKNINRYNYKDLINNYFNLIFKYDFLKLIELYYYHIINNIKDINLKI